MRQTVTENRLFSKKDLRKLIIPLILEQTLAITVGMADTMMISSAGEAAVSGVSLVDMFNNLIISVLAALATGAAQPLLHALGVKRFPATMTFVSLLLLGAVEPSIKAATSFRAVSIDFPNLGNQCVTSA